MPKGHVSKLSLNFVTMNPVFLDFSLTETPSFLDMWYGGRSGFYLHSLKQIYSKFKALQRKM